MKKKLYLLVLFFFILILVCGCTLKEGLVIRHDIQEDEVDIFYYGISPKKVKQAFGIPHCSRSNFSQTVYIYYMENGYIKVHFRFGKYVGNTLIDNRKELFELQPQLEESNDNKGKIDKDKSLMEVRNDISIEELDFINTYTTSKELQAVLGAPHNIKRYELTNCNWGDAINAVIYSLASDELLIVIFDNEGKVLFAWTEDKEGTKTAIVEHDDTQVQVKE